MPLPGMHQRPPTDDSRLASACMNNAIYAGNVAFAPGVVNDMMTTANKKCIVDDLGRAIPGTEPA